MQILKYTMIAATISFLCACGSDNKPSTPSKPTPPPAAEALTGTSAIGAPILGQLEIIDASGKKYQLVTTKEGKFEQKALKQIKAPALLKVVGAAAGKSHVLYSLLLENQKQNGIANVTPLTQLVISRITAKSAADVYTNFEDYKADFTAEKVNEAQQELKSVLSTLLKAAKVDADFNFLSSKFDANYTEFDSVLDLLDITFLADKAIVTYKPDTQLSITLNYNENWGNKTLVDDSKQNEVAQTASFIAKADKILESMLIEQDSAKYKTYLHPDAKWYGETTPEGIWQQKEEIVGEETDAIEHYRDLSLLEVTGDQYLVAFTEHFQKSKFASGGRARAWFSKNAEGKIKFLGQKLDLPVNIALTTKLSIKANETDKTPTLAIGVNGFPNLNKCKAIPSKYDNVSWFVPGLKLVDIKDYISTFDTIEITGEGINDKLVIDKIYKEVKDGEITGCHLAASQVKQPWGALRSLVIDGYPVSGGIKDNANYTIKYMKNNEAVYVETLSIGKTHAEGDVLALPKMEKLDRDAGSFSYEWKPSSPLWIDTDIWVSDINSPGSQRFAVKKGETKVSSKSLDKIDFINHSMFDNYGRSISLQYSFAK
ncbi:hypothetical protein [Parashewanella tropica]|uniref:hypothetical protein n=1 Tax=Parashewanella tropica TaxID=2547970 RepID=UPI001059D9D3|nr:hypothetical protein [Parashewanella tropica]